MAAVSVSFSIFICMNKSKLVLEATLGTEVRYQTHILGNSKYSSQRKKLSGVSIEWCHPTLQPLCCWMLDELTSGCTHTSFCDTQNHPCNENAVLVLTMSISGLLRQQRAAINSFSSGRRERQRCWFRIICISRHRRPCSHLAYAAGAMTMAHFAE